MTEDAHVLEIKSGAKWCWTSIAIFVVACVAGPLGTISQGAEGGAETMAAAINAATISAGVMSIGLVVAVIAFAKEKHRPVLRWVCLLLYFLPVFSLGVAFLIGVFR
jgi:hypothetical protein